MQTQAQAAPRTDDYVWYDGRREPVFEPQSFDLNNGVGAEFNRLLCAGYPDCDGTYLAAISATA